MRSKVTLSDVAARAGVSIATASRALSGKPRVSREMIERVHAIAAEMGYRADPVARALRQGSSRLVGMIVPVIGIPFFAQLIGAVEDELNRAGFELLLADSHGFVDEEVRRLRVFGERRVDGILLIPSDRAASAQSLASLPGDVPVVEVDRATDRPVADFVGVDNLLGMQLLFEHLAEQDVASVAFAGADDATTVGVERWEGFHAMARRTGIDVRATYRSEFSIESGAGAAEHIAAAGPLPDAIVAGSDQIAVGLVSKLRELGYDVPRDVLVTGFDGIELARVFWPVLTTVVQPVPAIAAEAVRLLLGRIDGSDTGAVRRNRIAPTLEIGMSSKRAELPASA
ncbi:LacI family DNA-binding transcriptional regulator [Amycolatopsis sp. GA6-003]|uniref:LacI family DNA-binding transcriptional regulator n=1 Tax=Amycolatopsis sp. GA6-003 TaxID=2652444 RepID=UPI0039172224